MFQRLARGLLSAVFFLLSTTFLPGTRDIAIGQELLYGGNGGHGDGSSINDGFLVIVDQVTAAITVIGRPDAVARLTGIAFDTSGNLFASTLPPGGFPPPPPPLTSTLIKIDPDTGVLLSTIGPITEGIGGPPISISDIAFQPGTGVLFGVRSDVDHLGGPGRLYTIDKTTGVATLVGDPGAHFGTIAFGPGGTLYEAGADFSFAVGPTNPTIRTLNPSTGAVLTSVPVTDFFGALAVRPSDGVLFGGTGDDHELFLIDPATGALTEVGDTGQNFVGGLTFRAQTGPCVPDDQTLCLNNGRFSVATRWRTADGRTGQGTGVKLTSDSGYFWFFNPDNIEVVTKVLNACGVNGRYWTFAAGLTNVEVTLFVTDRNTGALRTYMNPLNSAFQPVLDTGAFATCP